MSQRLAPYLGSGDPTYIIDADAGPETFSLPKMFAPGRSLTIRRPDSSGNAVTILAAPGDVLNGTLNGSTSVAGDTEATFRCFNPGLWRSYGDGGPSASTLMPDAVTYNTDGTVATSAIGGVISTYTYNGNGTVATESRLGKTKTYQYDSNGNVTGSVVA